MNPFGDAIKLTLPVSYHECSSDYRRLVREEYVRRQDGRCQHCNERLDGPPIKLVEISGIDPKLFPPGFLTHPIHLHHDHKTGMTIGAVHARCNAYLWQYKGE